MNTNPEWITWAGGPCPIPDTVTSWEYKARDGFICRNPSGVPSDYTKLWEQDHPESMLEILKIVAYRFIP